VRSSLLSVDLARMMEDSSSGRKRDYKAILNVGGIKEGVFVFVVCEGFFLCLLAFSL